MTRALFPSRRAFSAMGVALAALAAPALAAAADATPLPIQARIEAMRVVAQYRVGDAPSAHQGSERVGILRDDSNLASGIFLLVSLAPTQPWSVRGFTVDTASARLDSGDALRDDGGERGHWFDNIGKSRINDVNAVALAGIQLGAPAKSAKSIGSLQATFRAIVADTSQIRTYTLTPKTAGKIHVRGLSEEANSDDLVLSLGAMGVGNQVVCDYRDGGLVRLKGLRVLDGDGAEMPITSSSWSMNGPGQKRVGSTFIFARPVASVALDVYDSLRAGTVGLVYTDLPLGGALSPEQREREATWREAALPAAFAAPIEIMPPQQAAPPARPAPAPTAAPGARAP